MKHTENYIQICHKAKTILFIMFGKILLSKIWEVFKNGKEIKACAMVM